MNARHQSSSLRVIVNGALGRMGQEVISAISDAHDMIIVCGVDVKVGGDSFAMVANPTEPPLQRDLGEAIDQYAPEVMVDFTTADVAVKSAELALGKGVAVVVGTTGLSDGDLLRIREIAETNKKGALVAPNFAVGAVLLMHLAKIAARYFEYADIIESHHEKKIDAPSGTAQAIADSLSNGRGKSFLRVDPEKQILNGSMGAEHQGIGIHSMRMPGRLAHHEVVLGTSGQTLSLRHDTIGRECYMPGVLAAIRQVVQYDGLVIGLDKALGFLDNE